MSGNGYVYDGNNVIDSISFNTIILAD